MALLSPSHAAEDAKYFQRRSEEPQAELYLKSGNKLDDSLNVICGATRALSPDFDTLSIDESSNARLGRNLYHLSEQHSRRYDSHSPAPPSQTIRGKLESFWVKNKGLALVLMAQLFGTLMNVTTRILEIEGNNGKGFHPFQILFARMSITVACSSLYMWIKQTEHFPWGLREVRALLVARGLAGFLAVFGMYYSLLYLPLADATVITFLAPSLACWACSFLINEPFTRTEQMAAYISLFGVVLIARPVSLFASLVHSNELVLPVSGNDAVIPFNTTIGIPDSLTTDYDSVTPTQRAAAVGIAMMGVLGATGAYTTVRWIGKRAHPLITVNYLAVICTIVSFVAMFTVPGVGFLLPQSLKDWCYLIFLGVCGFVMFLLAAGLQYEKSSRATNMVYTQMLFALAFDKLVWGTTPGLVSIIGSSLILGSAIYVAMHKEESTKSTGRERGDDDEERGLMMANMEGLSDDTVAGTSMHSSRI